MLFLTLTVIVALNMVGLITICLAPSYMGVTYVELFILMAAHVIVEIVYIVLFVRKRDTTQLLYASLATYLPVYLVDMIMLNSNNAYIYMIPLLFCYILFKNRKVMRIAAYGQFAINLAIAGMLFLRKGTGYEIIETTEMQMTDSTMSMVIALSLDRLMRKFEDEKLGRILKLSDESKSMTERVLPLAKEVSVNIGDEKETLTQLCETSEIVDASLGEISETNESTVQAVDEQVSVSTVIKERVDEAYAETEHITEIADTTRDAVVDCSDVMTKLNGSAAHVRESNEETKIATKALQDKSVEVRDVTDVILNISSQINLLALNASIEAARAGESGRGFAVVAEEIGNLADQTKAETQNIASTLDTLVEDADIVAAKVDENVADSQKQQEMIETVSEKIGTIRSDMETLRAATASVSSKMSDVQVSNEHIETSTAILSDVSRKVQESTEHAIAESAKHVEAVGRFRDDIEHIETIASHLTGLQSRLSEDDDTT